MGVESVPWMVMLEGNATVGRKIGDVSVTDAGHEATVAIVNLVLKYINDSSSVDVKVLESKQSQTDDDVVLQDNDEDDAVIASSSKQPLTQQEQIPQMAPIPAPVPVPQPAPMLAPQPASTDDVHLEL